MYNMKKIAFVTNSIYTFGGEQRVVSLIANELSKVCDVSIYTEDDRDIKENPYNIPDKIHVYYNKTFKGNFIIKVFRVIFKIPFIKKLRCFEWTWKITHYNKYLAKRLKNTLNDKYETVIGVSDRISILLGMAKQIGLKSKIIVWEHNSFECYFRTPYENLWKQDTLFYNSVKNVDYCVVLNEDYAEKYKKYLDLDCKVIYNPRSFISRKKSGLTEKTIITCCRLSIKTKGLDLLIKSFKIFSKKNTDWILKIVGNGPDEDAVIKLIKDNDLEDKILLLGYRTDIKELLIDSSLFLLSSRWEGFPMSITEAFECGLPVVAFDIPATIPFEKTNAMLLAKSYDEFDFAEKISKLTNDYALRKKMSEEAIKFAESLSIENIIKKWIEII